MILQIFVNLLVINQAKGMFEQNGFVLNGGQDQEKIDWRRGDSNELIFDERMTTKSFYPLQHFSSKSPEFQEQGKQSELFDLAQQKHSSSQLNVSKIKSLLTYKIKKNYLRLKKMNPKISILMRNIQQDIRQNILSPSYVKQDPKIQQKILLNNLKKQQKIIQTGQILKDNEIVKQSCFRNLLVEAKVDNDVESDQEDMNLGIRYMYGELLYSIGTEMINKRQKEESMKQAQILQENKKDSKQININKQNHNSSNNEVLPGKVQMSNENNILSEKMYPKIKAEIHRKNHISKKIAIIRN